MELSSHNIESLQVLPLLAAQKFTDERKHLEAAIMYRAAEIITERGANGGYGAMLAEGGTYSIFKATQIYLGAIKDATEDLRGDLDDVDIHSIAEATYKEKL